MGIKNFNSLPVYIYRSISIKFINKAMKMDNMDGSKRLLFPLVFLCLICGIHSELTAAELMNMMQGFRASCQSKFDVSDDLLDGINLGRFPEDNQLKCYVKCVLEALNMMKKGKINHELAIKQIKLFMPAGIREEYLNGINTCKDRGNDIADHCDKAYVILKCFSTANEHFMFP